MILYNKVKVNNFRKIAVLAICLLVLSACAKNVNAPDTYFSKSSNSPDSNGYAENWDLSQFSSGMDKPYTPAQINALVSVGEMDRYLSPTVMRAVHDEYKRYVNNKNLLDVFYTQSIPYLDHCRQVFKSRGLPEELVNLAYVESGFNPRARSKAGAVGLWQFMPATGTQYGLEQSWRLDERKNPYVATEAAATYLGVLYDQFKDWELAIAAYNGGPGKINNALKATGAKNFSELCEKNYLLDEKLRLKDETLQYVPRFFAFSKIMRNKDALGVSTSPNVNVLPASAELYVTPHTDLYELCRSVGMSWEEFVEYNPAIEKYISPSHKAISVRVPLYHKDKAQNWLAKAPAGAGWAYYELAKNDTVEAISNKTGIPQKELRKANLGSSFKAGSQIRLPAYPSFKAPKAVAKSNKVETKSKANSQANGQANSVASQQIAKATDIVKQNSGSHKVAQSETAYSIARAYDISLNELLATNKELGDGTKMRLGQVLNIPSSKTQIAQAPKNEVKTVAKVEKQVSSQPAKQATKPVAKAESKSEVYVAVDGDTVWKIARKFNISPLTLLEINSLPKDVQLYPGDKVKISLN